MSRSRAPRSPCFQASSSRVTSPGDAGGAAARSLVFGMRARAEVESLHKRGTSEPKRIGPIACQVFHGSGALRWRGKNMKATLRLALGFFAALVAPIGIAQTYDVLKLF